MRTVPPRLYLLSIASAALQLVPFPLAGPVPFWRRWFCYVCLTPLLLALVSRGRDGKPLSPAACARLGYVCGVLWYLGNCYWIYQTMHIYGDLPGVAACGILLLFSFYLGLYHSLFAWLAGVIHQKLGRTPVLLLLPFVWVAVEMARSRITGFPWDLLGYTAVDNHLLTYMAPLTGVMGLSFLVALFNCLLVVRTSGKGSRAWLVPGAAAAVAVVVSIVGHRQLAPQDPQTATAVLLQENLRVGADAAVAAPESKQQMLSAFSALSTQPTLRATIPKGVPPPAPDLLQSRPALIAWPEAPADFFDADPAFRQSIGALAQRLQAPVIVDDIAMAETDPDGHRSEYNSAAFFRADGSYAGRYDKMRLVPFGEYTPYKPLFFFAGHLLDQLPFVPGSARRNFVADGRTYGIFICYESIFGDDIRYFAKNGAQALVNISDDGWYGDSSAPWEHLDMVRMRAIENHRWIVRATNTGITVAIDPHGRMTATMPRHVRGSIVAAFGYSDTMTPYTRWGDWFGWMCVVVAVLALLYGYTSRSRGERPAFAVH